MGHLLAPLTLVTAFSGCLVFDEDYRATHVEAIGWINGQYDYEDIRAAFQDLGFAVDESEKPQLLGSNATMRLRSSYTAGVGIGAGQHAGTWALTTDYLWLEKHGERQWHDTPGGAKAQAAPLFEEARWHFDDFLRDVAAHGHGAWDGTAERQLEVKTETRTDYAEIR